MGRSCSRTCTEIRGVSSKVCWIRFIQIWVCICLNLHEKTTLYSLPPPPGLAIGFFAQTHAYGFTYGHLGATSQLDSTYAIVTALIAMDTPRQVRWHLENARRGGATVEETKVVREMAVRIAKRAGIVWRNVVPEVGELEDEVGYTQRT